MCKHVYERDGQLDFHLMNVNIMFFQQRQKSRENNFNSFLSDLEAKYSKTSSKPKRGKK